MSLVFVLIARLTFLLDSIGGLKEALSAMKEEKARLRGEVIA
jgi:hypothetical protein